MIRKIVCTIQMLDVPQDKIEIIQGMPASVTGRKGGGSSVHVSRGVVCTRLPRGRLYTSTCFQVQ